MDIVFKALNDATRREILVLLRKKALSAGDIAEHFQIGRPTISHHLDILKQADLVSASKQGQFMMYSINTTVLDDILTWLLRFRNK